MNSTSLFTSHFPIFLSKNQPSESLPPTSPSNVDFSDVNPNNPPDLSFLSPEQKNDLDKGIAQLLENPDQMQVILNDMRDLIHDQFNPPNTLFAKIDAFTEQKLNINFANWQNNPDISTKEAKNQSSAIVAQATRIKLAALRILNDTNVQHA